MLNELKMALEKNRMYEPGETILAACSGGPDSLALVHGLHRLGPLLDFKVAAAHLDHGFRGGESEAEALFVERFCREQGISCVVEHVDMPAFLKENGLSAQAGARLVRYEFLRRAAQETGATKIATGHQLEDQAETLLLNLLRGAGPKGLAAMQPVAGDIIRPLLAIKRATIEAYCRENGLVPRRDSSNQKTCYQRNWLRLEMMPQLSRFNAALPETLCRTALLLNDQQQFLNEKAQESFTRLASFAPDGLHLSAREICAEHVALQREIFRVALEKKRGKLTGISFEHVETLIGMLSLPVGSRSELPGGLKVRRTYEGLCLENDGFSPQRPTLLPGRKLPLPGEFWSEELGLRLKLETGFFAPEQKRDVFIIRRSAIAGDLTLRTRLPGDRFSPQGLNGSKKLKDFFIDEKVPRELRDSVPLLCDASGILWIVGMRAAQREDDACRSEQVRITIS